MPGLHGTLCINSFYTETELNITEIQEYEKQILIRMKSILQVSAKRDSCSA